MTLCGLCRSPLLATAANCSICGTSAGVGRHTAFPGSGFTKRTHPVHSREHEKPSAAGLEGPGQNDKTPELSFPAGKRMSSAELEAVANQAYMSAVDREARAWKEQAGSEFRTWREAAMARLAQLKAYSEQMEAQVASLRDENRALKESAERSLPPSSPSPRATDCASGFTPEGMTLNRTQLEGMTDANPVLDTIADMLAESESQSLMLMRQVEALQQQLSELSDERDECALAD